MTCWLYFNPKKITERTELHESYEQNYSLRYGLPSANTYTRVEPKCSQHTLWEVEDTFRDDEVATTTDKKYECGFCFQDLQHDDTIDQYHCSGCNDWYTKTEVETYNLF